jgi:hypothetical protein
VVQIDVTNLLDRSTLVIAVSLLLCIGACQPAPPHRADGGHGNPDTAAGKVGKLAYKVEKQTEHAAKEASKEIDKAARDAHAGYKDAERKSDH